MRSNKQIEISAKSVQKKKKSSKEDSEWSIYRQKLDKESLKKKVFSNVESLTSDNDTISFLKYGIPRVKNPNFNLSKKDDLNEKNYEINKMKQWKSNPDILSNKIVLNKIDQKTSISINDVNEIENNFDEENTLKNSLKNESRDLEQFQNEKESMNSNSERTKSLNDEINYKDKYYTEEGSVIFEKSKNLKKNQDESILSMDSTIKSANHPLLIVNKLYHEFDSTSNLNLLCGGARQKIRVLDNVSFEAKAGDLIALIATNHLESSTILDIMMNQHSRRRTKTFTEFYLNGQLVDAKKLSKHCAYVGPNINLCNQMSTRQTILFYNLLRRTNKENSAFDTKKRIDVLIEELGLNDVKHTCVEKLTESEKIRVQIAIALMLDTDLLLLDQPIRSMDIFDSYFIIDYIRQWTLISGKTAILALNPPSFEIFSLFNKVALLSTGRVIYFGEQSKLNAYFTYANYPCPPYKNPADYYLDLITVDYLSSSAMLESNHRIECLVQLYQKKKPLKIPKQTTFNSLPSNLKSKSFAIDFLAIWIRALIFCFPYNVINLSKKLLLSVSLSIVCGLIYFKMRLGREQEDVWDRFGFYQTILGIFSIPLFLYEIKEIHKEKKFILEELRMKIYSKEAYLFSFLLYTLPGASLIFLGFALPASSIAIQKTNLIYYLILIVCYFHILRFIAIAMSWLFSTKIKSSIAFGFIYFFILISGNNFNFKNLNLISRFINKYSIYTWTYQSLIDWEFEQFNSTRTIQGLFKKNQLFCNNNPLVQHQNAIVARAECGIQYTKHIKEFFNFNSQFTSNIQLLITFSSWIFILLIIWYLILYFLCLNNSHLSQTQKKLRENTYKRKCCKHEHC